jgi:Fur family peroxide stress response transcriptional regulator
LKLILIKTNMIRQTKQRQAILTVLEHSADHPTAAAVYERVRKLLPGIGFATVYRNLSSLAEQGLIREVQMGDTTQYDRRTDRHDHVVCRRCGRLADTVVPLPQDSLDRAAAESGFRVSEHHTTFYGLCAACQ